MKKRHFTCRAAGLAPWTDFREDTVSGRSLRVPRTIANDDVQGLNFTVNQRKECSFARYVNLFGAVYENSVTAVSTVVLFFLKYFVKISRLGKKFTHRLILCSFIYKSMYYISGFVKKYDGGGLKTMTMWQKILSMSACASRGFVGLQIKRDGGDLKIESSSHLSAVKVLKLKLNTLT